MKSRYVCLLAAVALAGQCFAQQTRYAWGVDSQDAVYRFSGQWASAPGTFADVSVGQDNSVWAVSRSGAVSRWNGFAWQQMPGSLSQISVATAQDVWGVSRTNDVLRFNVARQDWDQIPGKMRTVSVATDGSVWASDLDDNIFVWTGYAWQQFTCQARQISAGSATNVWGVTPKNEIVRYSATTGSQRWDFVPGALKQVSVGADGEVWGINLSDDLVRWNGAGWDSLGRKMARVSVGPVITGDHVVYGGRALLKAPIAIGAKQFIIDNVCQAGWKWVKKADLDALLEAAKSQPDPAKALIDGIGATAGQPIVSAERVYPDESRGSLNGWKYWALFVNQAKVAPLNTYFPDVADAADGTLTAPSGFAGRCVQSLSISPVQSDTGACSPQFSAAPDRRSVDLTTIRTIDLGRNIKVPTGTLYGSQATPAAPITPKPGGGAYINYLSTGDKVMLLEVDAQGKAGNEQDLGAGVGAGAVGLDGNTIGYLAKSTQSKLEFRIPGAAPIVIMDNDIPDCAVGNRCRALFSGRGIRFNGSDGQPLYGTEAMLEPMTQHRAMVHAAGGNWFVSFDHANNFNAYKNPAVSDTHWGTSMMMVRADGSSPKMAFAWGTSHSMDMRAISDGDRIIHVSLGDGFPRDIRARVIDARTGNQTASTNLFDATNSPDFRIGTLNGDPVNGIATNGSGGTAGRIGDLVQMGCGQYAMTYVVTPTSFTDGDGQWNTTVNELGMLVFDKDLKILKRAFIRRGDDVDFVKTARLGKSALLVAWKAKGAEDYWAVVIDVRGVLLQLPQKLPAGVKFDVRDSFVTLANGDIMWTARDGAALKLYRLPQADAQATAPQALSGSYRLSPQYAPNMCLDVNEAGGAGSKVQIWNCTGGTNQSFNLVPDGNGIYQIQLSYNPGLCLDVAGAGTSPGTNVSVWTCHGGTNQKWGLINAGGNVYELAPQHVSQFRMDVFGAGTSNGTQIDVWPANGGLNQKWTLVK